MYTETCTDTHTHTHTKVMFCGGTLNLTAGYNPNFNLILPVPLFRAHHWPTLVLITNSVDGYYWWRHSQSYHSNSLCRLPAHHTTPLLLWFFCDSADFHSMTLSLGPHSILVSTPKASVPNDPFTVHADPNVEQSVWTHMIGNFPMAATLMRHLQISDGSFYVSV